METLMHTCCAPCSVSCIRQLREEGIEPVSFWYNPNIHPYQEYKARRDTLMAYAPAIGMKLIVREDYGLRDFCRAVCGDIDHRCGRCYHIRLWETARYAAEHGYGSFTSTLFVSPYQNHELLRQTQGGRGVAHGLLHGLPVFRLGRELVAGHHGPLAHVLILGQQDVSRVEAQLLEFLVHEKTPPLLFRKVR